jgi:asparagine synthase (glutamine-hydrolysing)
MNATMVHRGPDDEGIHVDDSLGVALGARRLSIIDVAGGHQPLCNEDGSVWAVLNGEIYNHPALQDHLRRRGHALRTNTDTEVLVHLYEDHGDALVHALEGMFAFAIVDERRRRIIVARDRFGEKPLFYTTRNGAFTFASELDAVMAGAAVPLELDPAALDEFFVFGYVGAPRSIVRDVRQLPPGHMICWEAGGGEPDVREYWSPPDQSALPSPGFEAELSVELLRLLEQSVRGRMLSDVPLGVLLSGGIDSALLAAMAARIGDRPVKTFTVGYDVGAVDELAQARATARAIGTEHRELVLTSAELAVRAPSVLAALDQPLADPALVALNAVAEFAREHVVVAVGGEGADELFGGYPRYRWIARAAALDGLVPPAARRSSARALRGATRGRARRLADVATPMPAAERHVDWVTDGRRHARAALYGPALRTAGDPDAVMHTARDVVGSLRAGSLAAGLMALDQRSWLPGDVLAKADRAGMLRSLEIRTPYLHRELAEFAASIPAAVHLRSGGKHLLRDALHELAPGVERRRKTAFRVPLAAWLRGPLLEAMRAHVESSAIYEEGWFSRAAARDRLDRHVAGQEDASALLWPLFALGSWLDERRAP